MKTSIALMLCAACVLPTIAHAQTETKEKAPELKQGLAPSEYERELPALPKLDPNSRARTEIRIMKTTHGEIFQVEVVRQSIGDILRAVTAMMGVRAIIDPKLDELRLKTVAFRASNTEELLDSIAVAERWESASGTYFFAALPGVTGVETRDEIEARTQLDRLKREDGFYDLRSDLFIFPDVDLDSKHRFGRAIEPRPDWEKREFNGREFYYIPVPTPAK